MTTVEQNSFLALPGSAKGPGVLVLHAWWGLNEFFKDFCQRLAQEGFVVLAPDLYHGKTAATIAEAEQLSGTLHRKQASADILQALEELQILPAVAGKPVNVIGFSLGAFWALWLSLEKPAAISAVTIFYGTRGADYSQAQAAYLGHFAEMDEWESASGIKKLEKSLRKANRPVTFYSYEGTGHWFFEKDRPDAYNESAAQLAWERTVAFLKAQLSR